MRGCLLRVSGLAVQSVKLRQRGSELSVIIEDPEYGELSLTPACVIDILDLSISKDVRESDPRHGWRRVTHSELLEILKEIRSKSGR